jgi:hypothetical protein
MSTLALSGHTDTITLHPGFDGAAADLAREEALRQIPDLGQSLPDADGDDDFWDIEVERDHVAVTGIFYASEQDAQIVCEEMGRKAKANTFALVYRNTGSTKWRGIIVCLR